MDTPNAWKKAKYVYRIWQFCVLKFVKINELLPKHQRTNRYSSVDTHINST